MGEQILRTNHGREIDRSREQRLIEKLRAHPELTGRIETILELTESGDGKFKPADEVEGMLVEEVRRIGDVAKFSGSFP